MVALPVQTSATRGRGICGGHEFLPRQPGLIFSSLAVLIKSIRTLISQSINSDLSRTLESYNDHFTPSQNKQTQMHNLLHFVAKYRHPSLFWLFPWEGTHKDVPKTNVYVTSVTTGNGSEVASHGTPTTRRHEVSAEGTVVLVDA